MKKNFALLMTAILAALPFAGAAKPDAGTVKYWNYTKKFKNFRLPKPKNLTPLDPKTLKIDAARIQAMPEFPALPLGKADYLKIAEFYSGAGRRSWEKRRAKVARWINEWNLPQVVHPSYQGRFYNIKEAAEVYFFCGNPQIGKFVHDYVMHATTLEPWFWMGQTYPWYLRDKGKKRHANLDAPVFANIFNTLLVRTPELFTPEERKILTDRYREYVLLSTWEQINRQAKQRTKNNWFAIVSSGLLISARYFNDTEKAEFAAEQLLKYYLEQIEEDGSYGEGTHYCNYAMSAIPKIFPYLTGKQRDTLLDSAFSKVPEYLWYHQIFNPKKFYILNFGDSNYTYSPGTTTFYIPALLRNNPFALELCQRSRIFQVSIIENPDFLAVGHGKKPQMTKVDTAKLPLVRLFDNGELFIRSGWTAGDTHFAALAHRKIRTIHHRRKESGTFDLGRNGVVLVMPPGNTNLYFRPIHQLSIRTSAANTVTLDDTDQLEPIKQSVRFTPPEEDAEKVVSVCDLRSAYSQRTEKLQRTFVYLKASRTLVVIDELKSPEAHRFAAHLHLNNIFNDAKIEPEQDGFYTYTHPKAKLGLWFSQPVSIKPGYTVTEEFSNWDEKKQSAAAKRGTNLALTIGAGEPVKSGTIISVIAPEKPQIVRQGEGLTVNKVKIR